MYNVQNYVEESDTIPVEVIVLNYRDYQNVRDAAWRILLDCGITSLPVDLNIICKELGVRYISYSRYWRERPPIAEEASGMTFYMNGEPIILYDDRDPPGRIRFTVAHELGHLILGHVKHIPLELLHRNQHTGNRLEAAADQFAARLLAPACVLWGLELRGAEEIRDVCHISYQAAVVRARRMAVLYQRNKFLTSPLERELYRNFEAFIGEGHPALAK